MSVTTLVPRPDLTASTARQLTDSIKADVESLWDRLLSAYERGAHTALGYDSWADYMREEFGTAKTHSYQLLDAAKVARAIAQFAVANSTPPKGERVARELVPILKQKGEEAVADLWVEVVDEHGPEPTAEETRGVVVEHQHRMAAMAKRQGKPGPRRKTLNRDQVEFGRNLRAMALCAEYASLKLASKTKAQRADRDDLLELDGATLREWQEAVRVIDNASRQLRRVTGIKPKDGKEATT
jgi:hypothetical protein